MTETKEIPKGFDSWLQFYDHVNKTIPLDTLAANSVKTAWYNPPLEKRLHYIKIETLKAKCFDELNRKRISRELSYKLLSKYNYIECGIEDYNEVSSMIEIMTLSE